MQPSSTQSFSRAPLTHLLATAGHVRVLRAMLNHGGPLSVGQIAADAGLSTRGTRDVLASLLAQRAITVMGPARGQLFSASMDQPMVQALRAVFEVERTRWDELLRRLREGVAKEKHIRSAWLYGSVAHGTDQPHSDLDLALAIDVDTIAVSHGIRESVLQLGDSLGVQVSAVVLTPRDLAKLQPDDAWWSSVVRDAKVLKGVAPENEVARHRKGTPA